MQDGELTFSKDYQGSPKEEIRGADFSVETDEEGRFRLWFRNRLAPQITVGEWVGITISARCFMQMVDALQSTLKEMLGEE